MNTKRNLEVAHDSTWTADKSLMMTISEEVLLLILDYDHGCANYELSPRVVCGMIAGAILLDLCEQGRIEVDSENLTLVDPGSSGDPVLDRALSWVGKNGIRHRVGDWVDSFAEEAEAVQQELLDRLVDRGILVHSVNDRYFVMGSRHFMTQDGVPFRDVRRRIAGILLNHEMPTVRDTMIIHLAAECGLWNDLIDESVMSVLGPRIENVARLDLIGRSVAGFVNPGLHAGI